jgi:hypothetical protein
LPIHHLCKNSPELKNAADKLGITAKHVAEYASALALWSNAGFPSRKQAEVERLETICRACEYYRKGRCAKCGCCVNKSRVAVLNKIKMATESCPIEKW